MRRSIERAVLFSGIAVASGAGAQSSVPASCATVSGNFVANCGFESGAPPPSGPDAFGTLSIDANEPHTGSFALRGTSQLFIDNTQRVYANSNCFALEAGRTYRFGGWTRVLATTTAASCGAFVVGFTEPGCAGGFFTAGSAGIGASAPTAWLPFGSTISSTAWASGYLQLTCTGGGPGDSITGAFDDVFFADLVFADGFE